MTDIRQRFSKLEIQMPFLITTVAAGKMMSEMEGRISKDIQNINKRLDCNDQSIL